jgi:hypothetical protein
VEQHRACGPVDRNSTCLRAKMLCNYKLRNVACMPYHGGSTTGVTNGAYCHDSGLAVEASTGSPFDRWLCTEVETKHRLYLQSMPVSALFSCSPDISQPGLVRTLIKIGNIVVTLTTQQVTG